MSLFRRILCIVMNKKIEFSEEQSMLLDSAMDFCQKESPLSSVRDQFVETADFNEARWQSMSDLGWLSITIPEAYGGLGLSLAHVVPIIESMGRQLMASPFLATTLATQALINFLFIESLRALPAKAIIFMISLTLLRTLLR